MGSGNLETRGLKEGVEATPEPSRVNDRGLRGVSTSGFKASESSPWDSVGVLGFRVDFFEKNGWVGLDGWFTVTRGVRFAVGTEAGLEARHWAWCLVRPLMMSSISFPTLSLAFSSLAYLMITSLLPSFLDLRDPFLPLLSFFGSFSSGCFPIGELSSFPFGFSLSVRCRSGYRLSSVCTVASFAGPVEVGFSMVGGCGCGRSALSVVEIWDSIIGVEAASS